MSILAGLLIGGVIAQVLIQTLLDRRVLVDPVLSSLAGTAVAALFGQQAFLGHQRAAAAQREDYLAALVPLATTSAASGSGSGNGPARGAPPPPSLPSPTTTTPQIGSPSAGAGDSDA